jgi:ribosome biogenesis GTPase / thiamine phosphate phosphatase
MHRDAKEPVALFTESESIPITTPAEARPPSDLVEGTVVDGNRGQYRVETPDGVLLCTLRGKLRKELIHPISHNVLQKARRVNTKARAPVAVGDSVRVLPMGAGKGIIEEILARTGGAFTREDPDAGRVTPVAGIDQMVIVLAVREPAPHLGLLDRFLVLAEAADVAAVICANKLDLGLDPALAGRLDVYRALGYPVILASAETGAGLEELRAALAGHTSALLGPSGVGKSSLLNALEPGLWQQVSNVSSATHKGRHTTSSTRLVPLAGPGGGHLADTAGIRTLALGGAAAGRLDWCFREFRPYLGACYHADCTHRSEPGCAIRAAAGLGALDAERYASYVRLYDQGGATSGRAWKDVVSSRSLAGPGELRL